MVLPQEYSHYGTSIGVLSICYLHRSTITMVPPYEYYHYGTSIGVLSLWYLHRSTIAMVLPQYHYGITMASLNTVPGTPYRGDE